MVKAPVQVYGVEGRYATALFSAASKNQVVAFILAATACSVFLLVGLPQAQEAVGNWLGGYAERLVEAVSLLDHFDHALRVAGVDHVGIGADWDGVPSMPYEMDDVSALPRLTLGLLERGHLKRNFV